MPDMEMADVYRSLVANLKDKLGGTITDANADAIAHAAAEVYRRDVEPRLWEEKSAHQVLDSLGVPRSGAFVPYSLSDRLLLLRRSGAEDPYRAQAHDLLDELGVPRLDPAGGENGLRARLTLLLESLDGVPGPPTNSEADTDPPGNEVPGEVGGASAGSDREEEHGDDEADRADGRNDGMEGESADGTVAGPELVDALEAIQRAVGPAEQDDPIVDPPPPPPPPPTPDLIGIGSLLGTIQQELAEVRQAVESLREEVRDAVAVFQAAAGPGPEVVVRRTPSDGDAVSPEADREPTVAVPAEPIGVHEPTRVLPPVTAAPSGESLGDDMIAAEPLEPSRRPRRIVRLVVLVVLIGVLLAAGITAAIVIGWEEMRSSLLDVVAAPLPRRAASVVW